MDSSGLVKQHGTLNPTLSELKKPFQEEVLLPTKNFAILKSELSVAISFFLSKPSSLSRLIITTGLIFSGLGSQRCAQWWFKHLLVFVTRLVMQAHLQLWWIRCITLLCPLWTEKTACPVMKTETFTVKLGGTSATVPLIGQTRQVTDRCPWMS